MKRTLLITLSAISLGASAQSIELDFGYHPNKHCVVYLKNGMLQDTIFNAKLDIQGKAKIALPKEFTAYKGMANVTVNNPATLDFIVAGEDMTIRCAEEYPHAGNVEFINSKENTSLRDWFTAQSIREQKLGLLSELGQQYSSPPTPKGEFGTHIHEEITKLKTEQSDFEVMLNKSSLYTAKFIQFNNKLNRDIAPLYMADSTKQKGMRQYVTDTLNFDNLYTSGLWFPTINGLLELYGKDGKHHNQFIPDMSKGMKRIQSDRVYIALAEDIHTICTQLQWEDKQQELFSTLANEGRLKKGDSEKLNFIFQLFRFQKGGIVPPLSAGMPIGRKLIVFHQSGCNNCHNELVKLQKRLEALQGNGITVVSVSADTDSQVYQNSVREFTWADKRCDWKGYDGSDFKNYGVIGTPTFLLIDENNRLEGQYYKAESIEIK